MDFYEVIRTRRSVRKYRHDPVPEEVLTRVLDAARIAPSGSNRQPTRFIVIADQATKWELVPLCHSQEFLAHAPLVIVACGRELRYNRGEWMGDYSVLVDVAIAVDHLTLAARAEGLGTCWIGSFNGPAMKDFFGLPADVHVCALTPLGYPDGEPFSDPVGRKPLEELVMWEKWVGA